MSYAKLWLIDRSRLETGHNCQALRYYRYHAGEHGYGMIRAAKSMPLVTGGMVHECLADMLKAVQQGLELDRMTQELIVSKHSEKYRKLVEGRGFIGVEDTEFLLREQQSLMAGLAYTWVRVVLPLILEDWEILHVEEEFDLPLTYPFLLMAKPDVVLRHRRTGEVKVWDWKTVAYITKGYVEAWSSSPQMMLTSHVVSVVKGYKVTEYFVGGLQKGQRKNDYNRETSDYDGPERQQSPLCWPYYNPGTPPFVGPQWRARFTNPCENVFTCDKARGKRGKPHKHQLGDTWERRLPDDPYAWAQDIPMKELQEVHQLLGPYEVDHYKVDQMLRAGEANERAWLDKVLLQYGVEENAPWDSAEVQNSIDVLFPRSYNCFPYGRRCAYYDLCFKKNAWRTPLQSGFLPRRPHHQQELDQMRERGVPIPDEYGDFEEEAPE